MSDDFRAGREPLPPSLVRHVDLVCNQFEEAWRGPQRPRIEAFLGETTEPERSALLRELVLLEVDYRRARGEACQPDEYAARFPTLDPAWLAEALASGPETPPAPAARYRPLRFHARGGVGEVYVALDGELNREVALKRIQPRHATDPDSQRRFLCEAEITGRLQHPGIVPVYGLTHNGAGQPCYAMRFIEGESLGEAIRRCHDADRAGRAAGERRLALRQLLNRFVTVCHTVAYAHSRGIVHRDLKPGNIMLGTYGETVVVDWGLAKSLEPGDTARGASVFPPSPITDPPLPLQAGSASSLGPDDQTQPGQVLGTPAYMSPEQAAGRWDEVGPASDLYSLGATLHTLLTGTAPSQAQPEAGRPRPLFPQSPITDHQSPRSEVPRALEAICQRAMAPRPEDRYPTAQALAADVEHWLADEPVAAYREPRWARLGRWTRRHKPLVAGASALGLAAVLFLSVLAGVLWQAQLQLRRAQGETETSYLRARQALEQGFKKVAEDPRLQSGSLEDLRRVILQAEVGFYEEFVELRGHEPNFRAEQGRAYQRMGAISQELDQAHDAIDQYQKARTIFAALASDHPAVPEYRADLARGSSSLGNLYKITEQPQQAAEAFQEALTLQQRLAHDDPTASVYRADLARSHRAHATWHWVQKRPAEAEQAFGAALALQKDLAQDPTDDNQAELAHTWLRLGHFYMFTDRAPQAESALVEAAAIQRRLLLAQPASERYQQLLSNTCYQQGRFYGYHRRFPRAEQTLQEATALQQRLVREHPLVPQYQFDLARTQHVRGCFARTDGRLAEAEQVLREAVAIGSKLVELPSRTPSEVQHLGEVLTDLGRVVCDRGCYQDALTCYAQALAVLEPLFRKEPTRSSLRRFLGQARLGRARTLALQGDHVQAVAEMQQVGGDMDDDTHLLSAAGGVYAVSAVAAGPRDSRAELYSVLAVQRLRQAAARGWKGIEHLKNDTDYKALRPREDFQALVRELEGKGKTGAR